MPQLYINEGPDGPEVFEGANALSSCKCGHVAAMHGRASMHCTASYCRCVRFALADLAINVARCKYGHTTMKPNGECKTCNRERQARHRAKRRAKADEPTPPEPGTFEHDGIVYHEGEIWQKLRERGWLGARPRGDKPKLNISYRGP